MSGQDVVWRLTRYWVARVGMMMLADQRASDEPAKGLAARVPLVTVFSMMPCLVVPGYEHLLELG